MLCCHLTKVLTVLHQCDNSGRHGGCYQTEGILFDGRIEGFLYSSSRFNSTAIQLLRYISGLYGNRVRHDSRSKRDDSASMILDKLNGL